MASKAVVPAPAPWVERMTVANKMLAEIADDPFRASRVWDFAEAARVYAIQVNLGVEAVNHAVAVKLKAQRLLAEAVDNGQEKGEIAKRGAPAKSSAPEDLPKPIAEVLGRDSGTAGRIVSESRKIRDAFTEDDIDTAAQEASAAGEELTSAAMLARAREVAQRPVKNYLDGDDRVRRARFLHAVVSALPDLTKFDPAEVARHADEQTAETLRSTARQYADWMQRFEKARGGLRVVKGAS